MVKEIKMHADITVTNAERLRFLSLLIIAKIASVRFLFFYFFILEQPVGSLGRVSARRQHSFTQNPCVTDIIKVCN